MALETLQKQYLCYRSLGLYLCHSVKWLATDSGSVYCKGRALSFAASVQIYAGRCKAAEAWRSAHTSI